MLKQLSESPQLNVPHELSLRKRMRNTDTHSITTPPQLSKAHPVVVCAIMLLFVTVAGQLRGQIPGYIGNLPYVPGYDVNLFYDNQTGTVSAFTTSYGGLQTLTTGWGNTWTHIVPGKVGGGAYSLCDFLFYDETSGNAEFYSLQIVIEPFGLQWVPLKTYDLGAGYTIIVPGNFGGTSTTGQTDFLTYDGATGHATFYDVWGQANINPMKSYANWSPDSTIIVPGNFGGTSATGQSDLLIYNPSVASVGFFDVWGQGNINPMNGYSNWGYDHTIIVPGNFGGIGLTDILVYDDATGAAAFYEAQGQGKISMLKSYTNWSPDHSFILPGDFGVTQVTGQTDLMIYDSPAGGAYFDVWGQGNFNPTGTSVPSHHWSLITTSFEVVPQITSFSPASGLAGTRVTISGKNLNGAQRVQDGVSTSSSGTNVSFGVNSSTTITATMFPAIAGNIAVTTPEGRDISSGKFVAMVTVPNVVGDILQVAEQTLAQAGLKVGVVSELHGTSYRILSQSPPAGTQVVLGSAVSLVENVPY